MAKTPTTKGTLKNTKTAPKAKPRKKAGATDSNRRKTKIQAPSKISTDADPLPIPEPGSCCEACDVLATGLWGIPWRDAAGTWHCLEGPTVGVKVLRGDASGPYWANP